MGPARALDGFEDEVRAEPGEQPEEKHPRDEHRELELAVIHRQAVTPYRSPNERSLRRNRGRR